MSKFAKLYALAQKTATKKTSSLVIRDEEGAMSLRFDGLPPVLTAAGYETLAAEKGARVSYSKPVGEAAGRGGGTLGGVAAVEFVREMTGAEASEPVPAAPPATDTSAGETARERARKASKATV
jgi:hypothetical protein